MDNSKMKFPGELFDLVSARHTKIDAKQIYDCLTKGGTLVIEGVDQKDCWKIKELFGKGQGFKDKKSISEKDYEDLVNADFSKIEKFEIKVNEYYETEEELLALLLKTPILDDFSEESFCEYERKSIEMDVFKKFVSQNITKKGIKLIRRYYGIIARKQ